MADFLGVTKASVSKWEKGINTPDLLLLPQLAAYFDVTVDELVGYEVQLAVLYLNHYMLAETEGERRSLLLEAVGWCDRILEKCSDVGVCSDAVVLKAGLYLRLVRAAAGVALSFRRISQNLYGSFAKHNYRMGKLKVDSLLGSLCKREFRRYFSSSIYVTNTVIGPIMRCVMSGTLLMSGTDFLEGLLPVPVDLEGIVPFVIAGVFCTMTTTATSVSMEGKNWWILKSLPLCLGEWADCFWQLYAQRLLWQPLESILFI